MVARAAMTAAAAMQRKAIRLPVVTVGVCWPLSLLRLLLMRCLTAGDERWQPVHLFVIRLRRGLLRARLVGLGLRVEVLGLRLRLLLLALIVRLRFARREGLAANRLLVVSVVERVVGRIAAHVARLLLEIGLALAKLFLRGGDQTEIMFGVLIIVLGGNRIAGALRVAGQLQVLLGNVGRGSSNFHVLSIGLVHA